MTNGIENISIYQQAGGWLVTWMEDGTARYKRFELFANASRFVDGELLV